MPPNSAQFSFRHPQGKEIEETYAILRDRFYWMQAKGLENDAMMSFAAFMERQEKGQNFALFRGAEPVATVCLKEEPTPPEYGALMSPGLFWWIYGLSSHPRMAGHGYGQQIVRAALEHLAQQQVTDVYLDCIIGGGFLPRFYCGLGFRCLGELTVDEGEAGLVAMALFTRATNPGLHSGLSRR